MAGAYPDQPSYRMAWHKDGTQVFNLATGANLSPANVLSLNSESGAVAVTSNRVCVLFPELRDLDGLWLNGDSQTIATEVSVDTTNGLDGTWAVGPTVTVVGDGSNPLGPGWRTSIASSTTFAIRGIRFTVNSLRNIHLYGEIAPAVVEDRIEFWSPTVDQKINVGALDWGNTPRYSTDQRTFRLKNMSPTLTAHAVIVSMAVLTDTNPSVPAQNFLSRDGTFWAAEIDAGTLSPLGMSPTLYLRRVTPSNAVLVPPRWAFTIEANPTSWS